MLVVWCAGVLVCWCAGVVLSVVFTFLYLSARCGFMCWFIVHGGRQINNVSGESPLTFI